MIYITQQQKEEWEAKIAELEDRKEETPHFMTHTLSGYSTEISIYKELLSKAIVLPVEESWNSNFKEMYKASKEDLLNRYLNANYPNGVIIKQTT